MANGIRVTTVTDSKEWSIAVGHLADIIRAYTADASLDAAEYVGSIAKAKLAEREHGPLTFSPSPPGSPPAMVSGDLAASITAVPSGGTSAMVGPTTKYGRIQELGGTMHGHMRFRKLAAWEPGSKAHADFVATFGNSAVVTFHRSIVKLPPRPYLEPATEDAVDSGRVRDIYAQWWADAIETGAG